MPFSRPRLRTGTGARLPAFRRISTSDFNVGILENKEHRREWKSDFEREYGFSQSISTTFRLFSSENILPATLDATRVGQTPPRTVTTRHPVRGGMRYRPQTSRRSSAARGRLSIPTPSTALLQQYFGGLEVAVTSFYPHRPAPQCRPRFQSSKTSPRQRSCNPRPEADTGQSRGKGSWRRHQHAP